MRRRRADLDELVGEGLIGYAAGQGSPAALALLSGIACLGTPRQAALAEQAALELMERGVARPGWAEHAGAVAAAECYVNSDPFGDRDEVVCVFSYAGQEQHALVVIVDYNSGGAARDGWVTSQVGKLLDYCRDGSGTDRNAAAGNGGGPGVPGRSAFAEVPPPQARRLLETALAVTDGAANPPVSESFPAYHAFIRSRVHTLPPASTVRPGATAPAGQPAAAQPTAASSAAPPSAAPPSAAQPPAAGPAGRSPLTAGRRPVWRKDRRAMLVAEFLASDEAEDLSDRQAASRCADHIVEYGCELDFGRPLRVSPAKAEAILLDWLPRKVMLSAAEQHAMPHVLAAWVRWAGRRSGLGDTAIRMTLDAVYDSMGTFSRVYHDPSSFGLEPGLVARLLPDRDLEALPRRAFAFGVLAGTYRGVDLAALDPASPDGRRTLLAAEHDAGPGPGPAASREHLDHHLALADRLWRGDPPELWEASQRLLDAGQDRHEVLHILIGAIRAAGPREDAIAAALADLPPEEPGR